MMGFAMGLNEGLGPNASSSCGPINEKYMSINGLPGVEFELVSCPLRGRVRIATKLANGHRQVYVLAALYMNEDDNVPRFLNSLAIDSAQKDTKRR